MKFICHLLAENLAKVSIYTGRAVAWLTIAMVALLAINVLTSWLFNTSWILFSELVTWMHSANFLLAAAYTLNRDEHVRVDIFYNKMSVFGKAWVNLLGTLLLLTPVCVFILWSSWSFVLLSFNIGEVSAEAGGMPALFIFKGFLLLMPALLLIEALAQIAKQILILSNHQDSNIAGAQ